MTDDIHSVLLSCCFGCFCCFCCFFVDFVGTGLRKFLFQTYGNDPDFHLLKGKSPDYVKNLRRSRFCLCPRGFAVWSPR